MSSYDLKQLIFYKNAPFLYFLSNVKAIVDHFNRMFVWYISDIHSVQVGADLHLDAARDLHRFAIDFTDETT